jgi:hypothetical protein
MKYSLLFLFYLILISSAVAQRSAYSNESIRVNFLDEIHLVTNISQNHHLLIMRRKQPPLVCIYDETLTLKGKKELPLDLFTEDEIQLFSFKDFYYIYTQSAKTKKHQLWKVNATGVCTDVSNALTKLLQPLQKVTRSIGIEVSSNRFYIVAHTIEETTSLMTSMQIISDSLLRLQEIRQVSYLFEKQNLHRSSFINDDQMLVLSTGETEQRQKFLKLMNINTKSGEILATNYKSSGENFLQPNFLFNPNNGNTILYSFIQASIADRRRNIFITKLNDSLVEVNRATVHQMMQPNFFLLLQSTGLQQWINLTTYKPIIHSYPNGYRYNTLAGTFNRIPGADNYSALMRGQINYISSAPTSGSIKFSILNNALQPIADSIELNNKKKYQLYTEDFAQFNFKESSYLILKQSFPSKGKGLLLVHGDEDKVQTIDARVYERYDYLLPQLKQISEKEVLIPFLYKREAGIMKLKME